MCNGDNGLFFKEVTHIINPMESETVLHSPVVLLVSLADYAFPLDKNFELLYHMQCSPDITVGLAIISNNTD